MSYQRILSDEILNRSFRGGRVDESVSSYDIGTALESIMQSVDRTITVVTGSGFMQEADLLIVGKSIDAKLEKITHFRYFVGDFIHRDNAFGLFGDGALLYIEVGVAGVGHES